jgi:hypothetical protein
MPHHVQTPPEASGPPAVVLDSEGVTAWLEGEPRCRILWSQVESVAIEVITDPDLDYSEAFWMLAGGGAEFSAPIEVVVNAEQLNQEVVRAAGFRNGCVPACARGRGAGSTGGVRLLA